MKYIAFVFLFTACYVSSAQQNQKKKIVVVPYHRFEFNSNIDLNTIANQNSTSAEKIFPLYQSQLTQSLNDYQDENFEFIGVNPLAWKKHKKFVQYQYASFKGKKYYGTDLKLLNNREFEHLLQEHEADFIVFFNWYQIKKKRKVLDKIGYKYSVHYIDFDVYNLFKKKIMGIGRKKIVCDAPNMENIEYQLLRVEELKSGYQKLAKEIISSLNQPIKN